MSISVVVPTVGRAALLTRCLHTLAQNSDWPEEVLLVDQSGPASAVSRLAQASPLNVRRIISPGRNISAALNLGFRAARGEVIMVTHDDCEVAPDWIATGRRVARAAPLALHTGMVLVGTDGSFAPSTIADEAPASYTGSLRHDVLFPMNMVVRREAVLSLGGFDERFPLAAEDNDFCYRWLGAGRSMHYDPALRVWHATWRDDSEIRAVFRRYAHGQGLFYAKYLRAGDTQVLRFLFRDLLDAIRALIALLTRRRSPRGPDPRRAYWTELPRGFWHGWRRFR